MFLLAKEKSKKGTVSDMLRHIFQPAFGVFGEVPQYVRYFIKISQYFYEIITGDKQNQGHNNHRNRGNKEKYIRL
jgi:hypothetical protein